MGTKALLGAIIGDILRATFSYKNFVYDKNKPLLIEGRKITGYTVVTLAVARYIMDYHHLYSGSDEPGRIKRRNELLVSSIIDLAKKHPELEYPEWLCKWLASDIGRPTKVDDGMLAICLSPLVPYFSQTCDLVSTLRVSTETMNAINTNKKVQYMTILLGG